MSNGPLAREEIREACEAVGWEVNVSDGASGRVFWALDPTGPGWERFQHCMDLAPPGNRWLTPAREDALALLEAAVREGVLTSFALHYDGDEWTVTPENQGRWIPSAEDPALPATAVRAVLQATQTPGAEPREGGEGT